MEKYENFITKVRFQYIGLDAFNRQQLAEITRKQLEEKIELRIGTEVTILGIKSKIVELVFTHELLVEDGMMIVEHSKHTKLEHLAQFSFQKNYGGSTFSFFEWESEESETDEFSEEE